VLQKNNERSLFFQKVFLPAAMFLRLLLVFQTSAVIYLKGILFLKFSKL